MLESVIMSTVTGSVVCTGLLVFKNRLLSLLGGRALYYISLVAMLIFVLPMNTVELSIPEAPVLREESVTQAHTLATNEITEKEPVYGQQMTPPSEVEYNALPKPTNIVRSSTPVTLQEILTVLWLLGFIASVCRYFISYFAFKKKVCGFELHDRIEGVEVVKSPFVFSPMIFGFFKPILVIPEIEMKEEDYRLAIRHEMVHYRHHDSWLKLFAVFVNSVCWFNPITYFMVNLIGEACEYACDEQVIKEMDIAEKKKYSTMILSMVCQNSPALSSNMVKNKKQLKRRFEMIMKKKRCSILKTVLCSVLMLSLTCGSIVMANGVAPIVSSMLKDDYVYITNFGKGNYNGFVPVEKNGVYYLPWREFLNNSDVEDDKIKYTNGTVTVDFWSKTHKIITAPEPDYSGETTERNETTVPGKFVWSTSCSIGNKEVIIDGNKYILSNPPYMKNGITYVPYEYIKMLKNHEETGIQMKSDFSNLTSVFVSNMKYGFDSMENRFYIDDAEIDSLPREKMKNENAVIINKCYICKDADISISKTGYRTEFNASLDFMDINNKEDTGVAEIVLNKVTRIYSKGSDIEGLFTVKIDGETVYENEVGYITALPVPAGEGIADHGETIVKIGEAKIRIFFFGFGTDSHEEYSALSMQNREIAEKADTRMVGLFPNEVKLNGNTVMRTEKSNYVQYNINDKYAEIRLGFDDYSGEEQGWKYDYKITLNENSNINVIDESTFSGHFFLEVNRTRVDSFDAILTLMPDNRFELKSNNGKYIVRGTTGEYVHIWQWSEEQRNAPVPKVTMIDG